MSRFEGQAAVVTGGAQGIGRRVAEQSHTEGVSVFVVDVDADLAAATAKELGSRCASIGGDVANRADVAAAVNGCVERFGRIDAMMAHVGIADIEPFMEIGDASWQRLLDVTLTGAFLYIQDAACAMIPAGRGGAIVVTCSTNAFWVEPNATGYNASKGGAATLVRSAALDWQYTVSA